MKLPTILSERQSRRAVWIAAVALLIIGGAAYVYASRITNQNLYNTGKTYTNSVTNPITATTSNESGMGTITIPCGCTEKNKQMQPGQTSTSGTSLQNGSSTQPVQVQGCNPCGSGGSTSIGRLCPEYLCRAPSPSPSPTPTPTSTPPPGCGTCGGYGSSGTSSTLYVCPMLCPE